MTTKIAGACSILIEDVGQNLIQLSFKNELDNLEDEDLIVQLILWKNLLSLGIFIIDFIWFMVVLIKSKRD